MGSGAAPSGIRCRASSARFPFIWGTLYSSILALLIAAPVAIGIAVFLSDLCPVRLRGPLGFLTELLAAIPSIVYGMWGMFVLVPALRTLQLSLPEWMTALPLFSGPPVGVNMLSAAVVLAIMIVPYSSSVAREVLLAVPAAQREGAFALGATRWETIRVAHLLRARGRRRRHHARLRPGAWRNDGRHDGHRQQSPG